MFDSVIIWAYILFVAAIIIAGFYRRAKHIVGSHSNSKELHTLATSLNVKQWAQKHSFKYYNIGNQLRQAARMEANHDKDFFRADETMGMEDDGPYVEGTIQDRNIWLYVSVGSPRPGSSNTITREREVEIPNTSNRSVFGYLANGGSSGTHTVNQLQQVLYAWCLEISTHKIPHHLRVTRHDLRENDELDTESRAFEDRYDINNFDDSLALQLLDPHMIQLIEESRADAIEFSDSSVVIYEFKEHTTLEVLDALLAVGLKIAKQVDQNYPLGKYEKKAN